MRSYAGRGIAAMSMKHLDAGTIRAQINALLLAHPEIADDEILLADSLEGQTDLFEFLREIERKRRTASTLAEAVAIEIKDLRERRDRFMRRDEALRAMLFNVLQWAELKKAELPEATISIRTGSQKVIIEDENTIPDEYCRIIREPDKVKIKAALSEFKSVAGASLSNAEPVLAIRTK
jgi:hypothetical protein